MSDIRKLFSRLDFAHPALATARARLEAGDEKGALHAVVAHFRTRTRPTYLFDEADVASFPDAEVIAEADQIGAHVFFGYDLGAVIDWRLNPTADSSRDPEWM
jgi:hypothetical protein